jgi:hypothetical protein
MPSCFLDLSKVDPSFSHRDPVWKGDGSHMNVLKYGESRTHRLWPVLVIDEKQPEYCVHCIVHLPDLQNTIFYQIQFFIFCQQVFLFCFAGKIHSILIPVYINFSKMDDFADPQPTCIDHAQYRFILKVTIVLNQCCYFSFA